MTTYTPGPWSVIDDGIHAHVFIGAGAFPYGETIAEEVTQANARLIAAAPELLAALTAAHAALDSIYETEGLLTEERAALARIEAAIAKAEGRS